MVAANPIQSSSPQSPNTLSAATKPTKGYFIENMFRTAGEQKEHILQCKEDIDNLTKVLDPKEHKELFEQIKNNLAALSELNQRTEIYKKCVAAGDESEDMKVKLRKLVDGFFDLHHKIYVLSLDIRTIEFNRYFKVNNDIKISKEIIREIFHTLKLSIPKLDEYLKYKVKNQQADYRTVVRHLAIAGTDENVAFKALLESAEFKNTKLGKEKILVAEFPNLKQSEFNSLSRLISSDMHEALIKHIYIYDKKSIIFFLKNFLSSTQDLHGFNLKVALRNAYDSIRENYLHFNKSMTLMPGKGNHSVTSGHSVIKTELLKQLKLWKKADKKFIKVYFVDQKNSGTIKIEFQPVVEILLQRFTIDLETALQQRVHRVAVKLDKKYSPTDLKKIEIQLVMKAIMFDRNFPVVSHGVTQAKVEDDKINLFFTYENKNLTLFDQNFGFDDPEDANASNLQVMKEGFKITQLNDVKDTETSDKKSQKPISIIPAFQAKKEKDKQKNKNAKTNKNTNEDNQKKNKI